MVPVCDLVTAAPKPGTRSQRSSSVYQYPSLQAKQNVISISMAATSGLDTNEPQTRPFARVGQGQMLAPMAARACVCMGGERWGWVGMSVGEWVTAKG